MIGNEVFTAAYLSQPQAGNNSTVPSKLTRQQAVLQPYDGVLLSNKNGVNCRYTSHHTESLNDYAERRSQLKIELKTYDVHIEDRLSLVTERRALVAWRWEQ